MELSVCPVHVKIYQLAFKYYYRTEKLIKSTDNHNVPLMNVYLEEKQLNSENKNAGYFV